MVEGPGVLIVVPAWNEEDSVALVVKESLEAAPEATVLVVDDGSSDRTGEAARQAGAQVVTNVFNLGVGGAMRVGFRYAVSHGHRAVVQVDGDGQHDPHEIHRLLDAIDDSDEEPQVVIGARFAGVGDFPVPRARRWAMRMLARYLSRLAHTPLTDVTSGFRAHNRAAVELFARTYPAEYLSDTVESLVIALAAGGRVIQVPVTMRTRAAGTPSHSSWRAAAYLARVLLILLMSLIRRRPSPDRPPEAP